MRKREDFKRQTFETLISEEALLFAKYLRNEKKDWLPRLSNLKLKQLQTLEPNRKKLQSLIAPKDGSIDLFVNYFLGGLLVII